MKITLIMVSSVNGKITDDNDPVVSHWSSEEDAQLFLSMKSSYKVIVMGRKTYEVAKKSIPLNEKKLRIVMTKNPDKYSHDAISGKIEFTSESAAALCKRLASQGYTQILLVGGGEINSMFFRSQLIDELHITIEPKLFGTGNNFISNDRLHVNLRLVDIRKLNTKGSLHVIYKVVKNS